MVDLKGKIVLITGASSGIGQAAACQFAEKGARLILTARRAERLETLKKNLEETFNSDVLTLPLDVRVKEQVQAQLGDLPAGWSEVDVLVNNAGLALDSSKLQEGTIDHWDTMIDTNVRGLLYVVRAILPNMLARNSGHIVNISSIAAHDCYLSGNVYCATKHAVRALSKSMRIDLQGSALRVTDIAPGATHTEFSEVRWKSKERSDDFYKDFEALQADDIADAIVYCTTRPAHVDVSEMVIYPVAQASANHLYKKGEKAKSMFD